MKSLLIFAGIVGLIVLVTTVLSSASDTGEVDGDDVNVTGPLARDAVSESLQVVDVWSKPKHAFSRKTREEWRVGLLEAGDRFRVEKHAMATSGNLWVKIVGVEGTDIEGWVFSPSNDPFRAKKIR